MIEPILSIPTEAALRDFENRPRAKRHTGSAACGKLAKASNGVSIEAANKTPFNKTLHQNSRSA